MSDKMCPIPFAELMDWILTEHEQEGSVFGVRRPYTAGKRKLSVFGETLETPFGPAAGPHTQLAENIIAAWYAGSRFFELKTVQIMDGEELSKCVPKPCILAEDECYNCEWSTELTVPAAFEEYVKAWFALKLLSREFGCGDPDGFIFNMSVGYTYDGILSPKIDGFIESMKDASKTPIWAECMAWAKANLSRFKNIDEQYLERINPHVCTSITLSTLHGCPPQEIERIARHLIDVKKLHTFIKCNPTILGYASARKILDDLGFDYVSFDEHHFNEDLQYKDAVPMFRRLQALADENKLQFGLKLSNTFPVEVTKGELPSEEMYMSGRSLYPLTTEMARRITEEFDGKMRLSFSGGIDANNIAPLFEAGVWPITLATTILKPGGYQRFTQLAERLDNSPYGAFSGVSVGAIEQIAAAAKTSARGKKPVKPLPKRKNDKQVPLVNCFDAPCSGGCPICQDIPEYIALNGKGMYKESLELILKKNPLPFITGKICAHHCMDKCARNFYEDSVRIRNAKLVAAMNGYDAVIGELSPESALKNDIHVAVIGGGVAGMSAAYFLAREGAFVTLFEQTDKLGGIVRWVIPSFRIGDDLIDRDGSIVSAMGAKILMNTKAPSLAELKAQGFTHVVYAIGATKHGAQNLPGMNAIDFLAAVKANSLSVPAKNVCVIGGGNTAMDTARAAKRLPGVEHVYLVYRRTARYMPADEEELRLCMADGVEFKELLAQKDKVGDKLICDVMRLGAPDASGRRSPEPTGETVELPCDLLIFATGEQVDGDKFAAEGLSVTERGKAAVDGLLQTSQDGVYVIGDANRGPCTVVECIADARTVANAILGEYSYEIPEEAIVSDADAAKKHGALKDYNCAEKECERCLSCRVMCECCVEACPNRANIALTVPGLKMAQIVHIDRLCNECGNCAVFCPYASRPYKDKLTVFSDKGEFEASTNPGFFRTAPGKFLLRKDGVVAELDTAKPGDTDAGVVAIAKALEEKYAYLLV
ncbi:MAG: putative selenate reductase subunit YgfK [Clostridia bacterium]|nr:putative selenate reductase subunit YgfK [Clostridia bacterium]